MLLLRASASAGGLEAPTLLVLRHTPGRASVVVARLARQRIVEIKVRCEAREVEVVAAQQRSRTQVRVDAEAR